MKNVAYETLLITAASVNLCKSYVIRFSEIIVSDKSMGRQSNIFLIFSNMRASSIQIPRVEPGEAASALARRSPGLVSVLGVLAVWKWSLSSSVELKVIDLAPLCCYLKSCKMMYACWL